MKEDKQKFHLIQFLIFIPCFIAVWNLCDYLYTTFLAHNFFFFNVGSDILVPLIMAIPLGALVQSILPHRKEDEQTDNHFEQESSSIPRK